MTDRMQAAVLNEDRKLEVRDVPVPRPGPNEVLVRVEACGLCHTDLHYTDHGVPTAKAPPLILGHEPAGRVVELGAEVTDQEVGAGVLIPAVLWCDRCDACREGRGNLCRRMEMLGNQRDGAFSEYAAVPARCLVSVPDSLPLEQASLLADAVSTAYHAVVNRARVEPGDRVLVMGCGGVGLNVVQMAALLGATVIACDMKPAKLELARSLGAAEVVPAEETTERLGKALRRSSGGVDCAFEVIGKPATLEVCLDSLRPGGRACLVGYGQKPFSLVQGRVMFREWSLIGSLGCPPASLTRVVELAARGRLQLEPLISGRYDLKRIDEAFDAVRNGQALRGVVLPGGEG